MLLLWLHLGLFHVVCVALFPPPQCAFGVSCRAFWGFLPLFALLHLFPFVAVTKRRSSWACIGNRKREQETTEGTHAKKCQPSNAGGHRSASPQKRPPNQGAIHASCSRHLRMFSDALAGSSTQEGNWMDPDPEHC